MRRWISLTVAACIFWSSPWGPLPAAAAETEPVRELSQPETVEVQTETSHYAEPEETGTSADTAGTAEPMAEASGTTVETNVEAWQSEGSFTAACELSQSGELPADGENFPDPAFLAAVLEKLDLDGNGSFSERELAVSELDVSGQAIESLQGLEYFTQLQMLDCSHNSLSELTVPALAGLETLSCGGNPLQKLDLSQVPELKQLEISGGQLTCLTLSGCAPSLCTVNGQVRQVDTLTVQGGLLDPDFLPEQVSQVQGGGYDPVSGTFFFESGSRTITYHYISGNYELVFQLEYTGESLEFAEVPAQEPDCVNAGYMTHYLGGDGYRYLYRDGHHYPASQEELIRDALGHEWDPPVFHWDEENKQCTAEVTCRRDSSHTDREEGQIQAAVTREPTYMKPGETTYEAMFHKDWAQGYPVDKLVLEDLPILPHDHQGEVVPGFPATQEQAGQKPYFHCPLCEKNFEDPDCTREIQDLADWVTIPMLSHVHSLIHVPEQKPDCEEAGRVLHWHCTECGKNFRDAEGKQELTSITAEPLGHLWESPSFIWAEDGSSCTAQRLCGRDPRHRETEEGKILSQVTRNPTYDRVGETTYTAAFLSDWAKAEVPPVKVLEDIPSLVCSHDLQYMPGFAATETADGKKPYYHCRICGKNYENMSGTQEVPDLDGWIRIPKGHLMHYHPGTAPTCEKDGVRENWFCSRCERTFADPQGNTPLDTVELPALGHDWQIEYTWDGDICRAERTCLRDGSHYEEAQTQVQSFLTQLPTCEDMGSTTYLAVFEEAWAGAQVKTEQDVEALGHQWEEPSYTWSEDGKLCLADRVCLRDHSHEQQEMAEIETYEQKAEFKAPWARSQASPGPLILPRQPSLVCTHQGWLESEMGLCLSAGQLDRFRVGLIQHPQAKGAMLYCGMAGIALDRTAIRDLCGRLGPYGSLCLQVKRLDQTPEALTEGQMALLSQEKNGRLYRVTMEITDETGTRRSHDFTAGEVWLTVPFHVPEHHHLCAFGIGGDGSQEVLAAEYLESDTAGSFRLSNADSYLLTAGKDPVSPTLWILAGCLAAVLAASGAVIIILAVKKRNRR